MPSKLRDYLTLAVTLAIIVDFVVLLWAAPVPALVLMVIVIGAKAAGIR